MCLIEQPIMNIKKAQPSDIPSILMLLEEKAKFDKQMRGFEGQITTNECKLKETLFGDLPFAHVLLADIQDNVVGFAFYHFRYSSFSGQPSIWLDDLLVLSNCRSKGIGEKLMVQLKSEALRFNASHIAWTASPLNKKGQLFYERIGANIDRLEGDRPFFRWSI